MVANEQMSLSGKALVLADVGETILNVLSLEKYCGIISCQ